MFRAATGFIWDVTPTWLKVTLALFLLLILAPFTFKEWMLGVIRTEVHAAISPIAKVHETEVTALKSSMSETRADVRAIGIFLMGEERLSKMSKEFAANDGNCSCSSGNWSCPIISGTWVDANCWSNQGTVADRSTYNFVESTSTVTWRLSNAANTGQCIAIAIFCHAYK